MLESSSEEIKVLSTKIGPKMSPGASNTSTTTISLQIASYCAVTFCLTSCFLIELDLLRHQSYIMGKCNVE
ncbi:hypothetical protein ACTXT7_017517 [Hymenolepis weldensis]